MTDPASSNEANAQKRRSTRLVQAIPLMVIGTDALGQPFKERTSTLLISCHGCRYQSKHYVPVNAPITLEIPRPEAEHVPRSVQARVVWVQRPRTIRELFQIGVEFEEPGNIWGIAFPPKDWFLAPEEGPVIPAPAPTAAAPPEKAASAPDAAPAKPALVTEDQHILPPAAAPMPMAMARQMARLLAESKQHLQKTMQEGAAVVAEQIRATREQLDTRVRTVVQATVDSAMAQSLEQTIERAVARALATRTENQPPAAPATQAANAEEFAHRLEAAARSRLAEWQGELEGVAGQLRRESQAAINQAATDAQKALEASCASLEEARLRAVASQGVTEQAVNRAEESANQLRAAAQSKVEDARSQMDALLAAQCAELGRRADGLIAERARQLEPALAETAQQVLARAGSQFGEQLQQQLAPHVERAQQAAAGLASAEQHAELVLARASGQLEEQLGKQLAAHLQRVQQAAGGLAAAEQHAEEAASALRDRIQGTADQAARDALDRIRHQMAGYPAEFEEACRAALGKLQGELEAKTTEATHTTFEALYKSSEWYQKKAQTSMQATLEKLLEQASSGLRDRAAEVSRLFASELDNYSRNYAEHTRGLMEENAKETSDRTRNQLSQITETTIASFGDELHRVAGATLEQFEQAARQSAEQSHTVYQAQCTDSLVEFRKRLSGQIEEGVIQARHDLQPQLLAFMEKLRVQFEAQQRASLERFGSASNEAIDKYKVRLENASNSWLLASATSLGQHSQAVLETLAEAAEKRLRDICSQVFAGLGEVLRQRLAGLSTELRSPSTPTEKK